MMKTKSSPCIIRIILLGLLLLWALCPRVWAADRLDVHIPAEWPSDTCFNPASRPGNIDSEWWRVFNAPVLDSLIAAGEAGNYNLTMAARRIAIARSNTRIAQSAYYPSLSLQAGWSKERLSGFTGKTAVPPSDLSYFSGAVSMSWEIDVFGKITRQAKEAKAQVRVSAAEHAGVLLSLEAEIASTYVNLMVARNQLRVAKEHSESQRRILGITETRHETGLASKLDVAQASTLYYSTIASIPLLEASIEASKNALAVLIGTTVEHLPAALDTATALPPYSSIVAMGAPLDLLKRRPDVVQAERSVEAAAASLGVSRDAYLPTLSLNASIGTQAHRIGDLFRNNSLTYTLAPTISWTIFDGLSRRYSTEAARERMAMEIDNYNMTVLTAVEEVRNAAHNHAATLQYISRIETVVKNSAEEVKLSVDLYTEGLTPFSNVVDAMLNYLTYQNTLVSAHGRAVNSLIDLYKALGGGWTGNE